MWTRQPSSTNWQTEAVTIFLVVRAVSASHCLSPMAAYFRGQKDLFHGLALEQLEKDWTTYPVIYLDLNTGKYDSEDALFRAQRLSL